jgi:dolichol-phosphate mannosyltransferase
MAVMEIGVNQWLIQGNLRRFSWRTALKKSSDLFRYWWSHLLFPAAGPARVSLGGWYWACLALLALVAGSLLFLDLSYPLLEPDEGRYAEVAREMLASGDWIVPTLNGQPFHDKPPLFYWLVAGSFRLFGTNEWAARFVPTGAAFLTVLVTFAFGSRIVGARSAFLAAFALALMPAFVQCGRIAILDSLLTLLVGLSLFTAYEAIRGKQFRSRWWFASSICCALGVLTKGPIAFVLFAPPLAAYAWLNRIEARPTMRHWAVFAVLAFCLVAPWYIAVMVRDPKFAYHFFVEQHLVRFWMHQYHVRPVWYFVPVLLVGCLPWTFLLVPIARFFLSGEPAVRALRLQSMGYFALWGLWCVTFFSISSSKLPPYVLPAMPAIALLIGCFLDAALFQKLSGGLFRQARRLAPRAAVLVLIAMWLVMSIGAWGMGLLGQGVAFAQAGLCLGCVAALAAWGRRLPSKTAWLLCGTLAVVVIFVLSHELVPAWSLQRSPLKRYLEAEEITRDGQTPVACYGAEWGSIPFYVGRNDRVINLSEAGPKQIQERLSALDRYVLVVRHQEDLARFRQLMHPYIRTTKVLSSDEIGVALVESVTAARTGGPRQ